MLNCLFYFLSEPPDGGGAGGAVFVGDCRGRDGGVDPAFGLGSNEFKFGAAGMGSFSVIFLSLSPALAIAARTTST